MDISYSSVRWGGVSHVRSQIRARSRFAGRGIRGLVACGPKSSPAQVTAVVTAAAPALVSTETSTDQPAATETSLPPDGQLLSIGYLRTNVEVKRLTFHTNGKSGKN